MAGFVPAIALCGIGLAANRVQLGQERGSCRAQSAHVGYETMGSANVLPVKGPIDSAPLGVPSRSTRGEGHADIAVLELTVIGPPRSIPQIRRLFRDAAGACDPARL
jgi:hypothetical protein